MRGLRRGGSLLWVTVLGAMAVDGCRIGYEHPESLVDGGGSSAADGAGLGTSSAGLFARDGGAGGLANGAAGGAEGGANRAAGLANGAAGAPIGGASAPGGAGGGATGAGGGATASGAGGGATASGGATGTGGAAGAGDAAGAGATTDGGSAGVAGAAPLAESGAGGRAGAAGLGGAGAWGGTAGAAGAVLGGAGAPVGDLHVTTALDEEDAGATVAEPGGSGLSLREALTLSNAASGVQSITFEPNLVITLGAGLTVADGVELTGNGTTLDCSPLGGSTDCLTLAAASGSTGIHGLTLRDARNSPLRITTGTDYEITGCTLLDNGAALEVAAAVSNVRIAGNVISTSGADGIWAAGANLTIEANQIFDSASRSVYLGANASGARIVGNLIVRGNYGVLFANSVSGVVLRHNTMVFASVDELFIGIAAADEVTNNVFAHAGRWGILATDDVIGLRDYNAYFANGMSDCSNCSPDAHAITADPLFVDVLTDDYTPGPGSPLIDAGLTTTEDRNGAAAGLFEGLGPDIGCVETP